MLLRPTAPHFQVASLKSELIPLEQDVQHARDDACAASEQVDGLAKQINKLKFVLSSQQEDLLYTDIVQPFSLHCPEGLVACGLVPPYMFPSVMNSEAWDIMRCAGHGAHVSTRTAATPPPRA